MIEFIKKMRWIKKHLSKKDLDPESVFKYLASKEINLFEKIDLNKFKKRIMDQSHIDNNDSIDYKMAKKELLSYEPFKNKYYYFLNMAKN